MTKGRFLTRGRGIVMTRILLLRLLRGAEEDLADERLRPLGNQHSNHVTNVFRAKHAVRVFAGVRAELRVYRSGADDADPYVLRTQFLGEGVRKSIQGPF